MNYECSLFYGPYFYDDVSDFFFTENLINDGLTFFFSVCVLFWENKVAKLSSKFLTEGKYFNTTASDVQECHSCVTITFVLKGKWDSYILNWKQLPHHVWIIFNFVLKIVCYLLTIKQKIDWEKRFKGTNLDLTSIIKHRQRSYEHNISTCVNGTKDLAFQNLNLKTLPVIQIGDSCW